RLRDGLSRLSGKPLAEIGQEARVRLVGARASPTQASRGLEHPQLVHALSQKAARTALGQEIVHVTAQPLDGPTQWAREATHWPPPTQPARPPSPAPRRGARHDIGAP